MEKYVRPFDIIWRYATLVKAGTEKPEILKLSLKHVCYPTPKAFFALLSGLHGSVLGLGPRHASWGRLLQKIEGLVSRQRRNNYQQRMGSLLELKAGDLMSAKTQKKQKPTHWRIANAYKALGIIPQYFGIPIWDLLTSLGGIQD